MLRTTQLVKSLALLSGMFVLLPSTVSAETKTELFASHDKNGDGVLTIEDADYLQRAIAVLDKDKSGSVTAQEFQPFYEYGRAAMEDPFYYTPEKGNQISSGPYDGPEPKLVHYTIFTLDLTQAGKVRYATRKGVFGEEDTDMITITFVPPQESDITFG